MCCKSDRLFMIAKLNTIQTRCFIHWNAYDLVSYLKDVSFQFPCGVFLKMRRNQILSRSKPLTGQEKTRSIAKSRYQLRFDLLSLFLPNAKTLRTHWQALISSNDLRLFGIIQWKNDWHCISQLKGADVFINYSHVIVPFLWNGTCICINITSWW